MGTALADAQPKFFEVNLGVATDWVGSVWCQRWTKKVTNQGPNETELRKRYAILWFGRATVERWMKREASSEMDKVTYYLIWKKKEEERCAFSQEDDSMLLLGFWRVNRRNKALVFCWIFEKRAQRRSANDICYDALVSSQAFPPFLYAISLFFFYIITLSQPILTMLQGLVSTHTGNDRDGIPFQEEWGGSPNLAACA